LSKEEDGVMMEIEKMKESISDLSEEKKDERVTKEITSQ